MSDVPTFDWYEPYVDEDGEIDHDRARAWIDAAMQQLLLAPEGQALGLTDEDHVWIGMIQQYAHLYLGSTQRVPSSAGHVAWRLSCPDRGRSSEHGILEVVGSSPISSTSFFLNNRRFQCP
jgi:hypothetical protein